jgi:tetratricopeptide (TPR) repeat protein
MIPRSLSSGPIMSASPTRLDPADAKSEDETFWFAYGLFATFVLAGTVWAVYGRALDAPFICDDFPTIVESESIRQLWPLWGDVEHPGPLNAARNQPTCGRPLVNFTFALNYHFGQLNPRGYRLINIAIHTFNALLVAAIARRTLRLSCFKGRFDGVAGPLALAAALLWAAHPLVTETIVYVTQRTELMVAFFYMATIYGSLSFWEADRSTTKIAWLILAVLACWAGMASKEVMASAPIMVLLFDRTFVSGSLERAWHRSPLLYVGLFASWIILLLLNYSGPRSASVGFHLGVSATDYWFTQAQILLMYLKLAIWPWPLSIHYDPIYLKTFGEAWMYVLPVAGLAAGTLYLLWRRTAVGYAGAFVFAILTPTMLVPIVTEVAAEKRMYLPLATLAVLVVAGGYDLLCRVTKGRSALALVGGASFLLALAGGVVSAHRLTAFRDELKIWLDVVENNPRAAATAQYNVGTIFLERGNPQAAIDYFQRALKIEANYAKAEFNLGTALSAVGRHDEAIAHYRRAIEIQPDYILAHNRLGHVSLQAGRPEDAVAHFQTALRLAPNDAGAHHALAAALAQTGRFEDAVRHFEAAISLQPEMVQAHANLMAAYAKLGRSSDAARAAEQALKLAQAKGDSGLAERIEVFLARLRSGQPGAPDSSATDADK